MRQYGLGWMAGMWLLLSVAGAGAEEQAQSTGAVVTASADLVVEKTTKKERSKASRPTKLHCKGPVSGDNQEGVIVLQGPVLVDSSEFQLCADRAVVFLSLSNDVQKTEKKPASAGMAGGMMMDPGKVDKVVATGNVSMTNDSYVVDCDKLVYSKKENQLVLTGQVKVKSVGEKSGTMDNVERIVYDIVKKTYEIVPRQEIMIELPPDSMDGKTLKLTP